MSTQALPALPTRIGKQPFSTEMADLFATILGEGLEDPYAIAAKLNIPGEALPALLEYPLFRHRVVSKRVHFLHPDNAAYRQRRKADILSEQGLDVLGRLMHGADVPPAERIRAAQAVNQLTTAQRERDEMRVAANNAGAGSGIHLTLNLGFPDGSRPIESLGRQPVTIDVQPEPALAEAA